MMAYAKRKPARRAGGAKTSRSGYKSYRAKPRATARRKAPSRRAAAQTVRIVLEQAPSMDQQRLAGMQISPSTSRRAPF